jgi:glucokinase
VILAGDVGATKILLEVGEVRSGRWQPALERRYPIADFPGMSAVIAPFLDEWKAVRPPRAKITAGAIGVAGPARNNKVKMTHRAWTIDGDAIARRFDIPRVEVVNDLAATAAGIGLLKAKDFLTIQPGKAVEGEPAVVLGVGTGLGVAYLIHDRIVSTEGGHVGFSPASMEQHNVWSYLFRQHGRVEAEDIASGRGIPNIYRALTDQQAETAWICEQALARESNCVSVMDIFSECLGNIAGDQALTTMARGGIFLAGGVIARIAPSINKERFRAAFCAKGVMSSLLMRVPVRAITNEKLAVLGAAQLANRAL